MTNPAIVQDWNFESGTQFELVCSFLANLDLQMLAKYVETHYYSDKSWRYRYNIESILKLVIVKCFRKLSYHKTLASLTEEEIINLGFYNHEFRAYFLPCASTMHYFVKYRLGEKGLQEVMILLGKEIAQISSASDAKTDSTPMEASRYDRYAEFNPHYEIKMYKAHITMLDTYPVYMSFTRGLVHDSQELHQHIMTHKQIGANVDEYYLDAG